MTFCISEVTSRHLWVMFPARGLQGASDQGSSIVHAFRDISSSKFVVLSAEAAIFSVA